MKYDVELRRFGHVVDELPSLPSLEARSFHSGSLSGDKYISTCARVHASTLGSLSFSYGEPLAMCSVARAPHCPDMRTAFRCLMASCGSFKNR
jgi:hypothetical protein